MITIDPNETPVSKLQSLLQGAIAPRPIALASTIDKEGKVNLSPFSFFNLFSSKPPILVFSPSRRGRDNSVKHTYENMVEVPEVVINVVSYDIVEQVSLASVEFPRGTDEFVKSGLTPVSSARVRPPRVMESPVAFECKVNEIIPLGDHGGAGNLAICEILLAHYKEGILDAEGRVDPNKIDLVARMGNDYYTRASGESIFVVPKPNSKPAIGFDAIPAPIRKSSILTGNDLGRLGNAEALPSEQEILDTRKDPETVSAFKMGEVTVHRLAHLKLQQGQTHEAWRILLAFHKPKGS
jgi:flavin reductase (DIM6/NTAB) family NADH-FMN oxidoreductase RutF